MSVKEPESPYQLVPGPERRAMMVAMGIAVCLLDYSSDEWADIEAVMVAASGNQPPLDGHGQTVGRTG